MKDIVKIFAKIKDMSKKTLNPCHRILMDDISNELSISSEEIIQSIAELESKSLIKIHQGPVMSISLTTYGVSQDDILGWSESGEA